MASPLERRRCLPLVIAAAVSATLSARQPPADQRPPVTFRSEINFVEIDAIVTDRAGHFVPDLAKEDFEIIEEGKRQAISTFSLVRIPVDRAMEVMLERGFSSRPGAADGMNAVIQDSSSGRTAAPR